MKLRTVLLAVLSLAPCSRAGGFDPRVVPADAVWVLHVDLEGLARSTFLGSLHAQGIRMENDFDLDHVQRDFGLDPFVDLRSLTAYGRADGGTITLVDGTQRMVAAFHRLAADLPRSRVAGCEAITLGRGDAARHVLLRPQRTAGACTALLGAQTAVLEQACAVLDGAAPSLERGGPDAAVAPALRARPARGALVFAADAPGAPLGERRRPDVFLERGLALLLELADIGRDRQQTFARSVCGLEFELGEASGTLELRLGLSAATPQAADELERVLRSAAEPLTSADLPAPARELLTRLLAGLRLDSPGTRVTAVYRYSAREFATDMRRLEQLVQTAAR